MNYHVFIVNNTTFQYHLRYGFAGTGAGNREVSFLSKPETSFNYAVETNFVKMIADISRIRAGDKILFYLCATPTTQGAFYGVFKASSSAFFDESNANNYLRHELGKPLAFRVRIEPDTVFPYGVSEQDERIDYDEVRRLALEHKPKLIVAGASAYARAIDFAKFREIADEVGALLMVDMAHIAGLVAAGEHMSPVPYADVVTTTTHKTLRGPRGGLILCREQYAKAIDKAIFPGTQGGPLEHVIAAKAICFKEAMTEEFAAYQHQIVLNAAAMAEQLIKRGVRLVSGGTDNHLMLIDLVDTEMTGKELERLLGEANITANKNTVPRETRSPFVTSGLRVGTPAVTTRGMKEPEMVKIADMIADIIEKGEAAVEDVRARALELCKAFPLYG